MSKRGRPLPPTTRLKRLIRRKGRVLSVLHPPTAALARIMAVRRRVREGQAA